MKERKCLAASLGDRTSSSNAFSHHHHRGCICTSSTVLVTAAQRVVAVTKQGLEKCLSPLGTAAVILSMCQKLMWKARIHLNTPLFAISLPTI